MAEDKYDEGVPYWDSRYTNEPKPSDWILKYPELTNIIAELMVSKSARVLHVGCGNSLLPEQMYDDGYTDITNIDTSAVVIEQMRARNTTRPKMDWLVMDATATDFESGSFDLVLDKALLDTLLCEGDDAGVLTKKYFIELARLVSQSGVMIFISFGPPDLRRNKVPADLFSIRVIEVEAKGKNKLTGYHYVYVCRKLGDEVNAGQLANASTSAGCERPDLASSVVVSHDPLIVIVPNFLSKASCAALINLCMSADDDDIPTMLSDQDCNLPEPERLLLGEIEKAIGTLCGQASHDEESPLLPMLIKPTSDELGLAPKLPAGLHVDTNGGCPRRFSAALVYLTSPVGGETVFPVAKVLETQRVSTDLPITCGLAPDASVVEAAQNLVDGGVLHTRHAKTPMERSAADELLRAAESGSGLAVHAQMGSLVLFWCRDSQGVNARSWHSGMKVGPGGEKKLILRKFKSMPDSVWNSSQEDITAYVNRTRKPHMCDNVLA